MKLRYFFVALVFLTTTVVFSQETFVFDGGSFTDQITLFGTDEATLVLKPNSIDPNTNSNYARLTLELYVPHIFIAGTTALSGERSPCVAPAEATSVVCVWATASAHVQHASPAANTLEVIACDHGNVTNDDFVYLKASGSEKIIVKVTGWAQEAIFAHDTIVNATQVEDNRLEASAELRDDRIAVFRVPKLEGSQAPNLHHAVARCSTGNSTSRKFVAYVNEQPSECMLARAFPTSTESYFDEGDFETTLTDEQNLLAFRLAEGAPATHINCTFVVEPIPVLEPTLQQFTVFMTTKRLVPVSSGMMLEHIEQQKPTFEVESCGEGRRVTIRNYVSGYTLFDSCCCKSGYVVAHYFAEKGLLKGQTLIHTTLHKDYKLSVHPASAHWSLAGHWKPESYVGVFNAARLPMAIDYGEQPNKNLPLLDPSLLVSSCQFSSSKNLWFPELKSDGWSLFDTPGFNKQSSAINDYFPSGNETERRLVYIRATEGHNLFYLDVSKISNELKASGFNLKVTKAPPTLYSDILKRSPLPPADEVIRPFTTCFLTSEETARQRDNFYFYLQRDFDTTANFFLEPIEKTPELEMLVSGQIVDLTEDIAARGPVDQLEFSYTIDVPEETAILYTTSLSAKDPKGSLEVMLQFPSECFEEPMSSTDKFLVDPPAGRWTIEVAYYGQGCVDCTFSVTAIPKSDVTLLQTEKTVAAKAKHWYALDKSFWNTHVLVPETDGAVVHVDGSIEDGDHCVMEQRMSRETYFRVRFEKCASAEAYASVISTLSKLDGNGTMVIMGSNETSNGLPALVSCDDTEVFHYIDLYVCFEYVKSPEDEAMYRQNIVDALGTQDAIDAGLTQAQTLADYPRTKFFGLQGEIECTTQFHRAYFYSYESVGSVHVKKKEHLPALSPSNNPWALEPYVKYDIPVDAMSVRVIVGEAQKEMRYCVYGGLERCFKTTRGLRSIKEIAPCVGETVIVFYTLVSEIDIHIKTTTTEDYFELEYNKTRLLDAPQVRPETNTSRRNVYLFHVEVPTLSVITTTSNAGYNIRLEERSNCLERSHLGGGDNFTLAPGKYYIDVLDDVGTGSITVEPYTPPTTPPIKKEPVLVLPDLKYVRRPCRRLGYFESCESYGEACDKLYKELEANQDKRCEALGKDTALSSTCYRTVEALLLEECPLVGGLSLTTAPVIGCSNLHEATLIAIEGKKKSFPLWAIIVAAIAALILLALIGLVVYCICRRKSDARGEYELAE